MLKRNADIILRPIHGSYFLINISDNYSNNKCNLYEINETGAFLWNQIDKAPSVNALICELQKVLIDDVPMETLQHDVSEFVDDLMAREFVLEDENHG